MNTTRLTRKETIAEGTILFAFERPEGFAYRAGQSVDLVLVNPPQTDAEGNIRSLSLVSSPFEQELAIATRMRDTAFKRALREMPLGSELSFDGPFGSLTLPRSASQSIVMLAGGIGVTLFRSMIRQALHDQTRHQLHLLHSNRRPEDAPFLAELQELARQNSNFHFVPTMTEAEKSSQSWQGEHGYINEAMLRKHVSNISTPLYFLAGPSKVVAAMYQLLVGLGIDTDNIRTEEFAGY